MIQVFRGGTLPGDIGTWNLRHYPMDALLSQGTVTGGSVRIVTPPRLQLLTGVVAAADLISEMSEGVGVSIIHNFHLFPQKVTAWVAPGTVALGSPLEECGLECGSMMGAARVGAPAGSVVVQVYATGDGNWFLCSGRGDGSALVTTQIVGAVCLWDSSGWVVTIDIKPGDYVRGTVHNPTGTFSATITGAGVPNGLVIYGRGAGCFARSGAGAPGAQTSGLFALMNAYTRSIIHA